jgi:hypothetical protein
MDDAPTFKPPAQRSSAGFEVISWLIRESGSTRLKATLEFRSTNAVMVWAASAPYMAERAR